MMYKIARLQKFVGYNIMRSTKNVCVCVCVCVYKTIDGHMTMTHDCHIIFSIIKNNEN